MNRVEPKQVRHQDVMSYMFINGFRTALFGEYDCCLGFRLLLSTQELVPSGTWFSKEARSADGETPEHCDIGA